MLKYQKFQALILKKDVLSKNDQMLWCLQKPNEKLLSFVIILLWEVIYVHFYNWHRSLVLVPIMYDLIELIIEASLWSKDYSTFGTHPQHTSLMFMIVHVQMWCVCAQPYVDQTKKIFVLFVYFWKWFVLPMFFKVFQIVFVWKTCFWVFSWPIPCLSFAGS